MNQTSLLNIFSAVWNTFINSITILISTSKCLMFVIYLVNKILEQSHFYHKLSIRIGTKYLLHQLTLLLYEINIVWILLII